MTYDKNGLATYFFQKGKSRGGFYGEIIRRSRGRFDGRYMLSWDMIYETCRRLIAMHDELVALIGRQSETLGGDCEAWTS